VGGCAGHWVVTLGNYSHITYLYWVQNGKRIFQARVSRNNPGPLFTGLALAALSFNASDLINNTLA